MEKHHGTLDALTTRGLGFWRQTVPRAPDGSRELLYSLVLQGGIPTAFAAAGAGWLSDYVRAVIRDLEDGGALGGALARRHAQHHDGRVPASFRRELLIELVAELALRLTELRRSAARRTGPDLVAYLDAALPGWRDDLPIAMEDEDACRLIEGLVRQRPEDGGCVAAERVLVRDGGGYRFGVQLVLDGRFDPGNLPDGAAATLESAQPRLFVRRRRARRYPPTPPGGRARSGRGSSTSRRAVSAPRAYTEYVWNTVVAVAQEHAVARAAPTSPSTSPRRALLLELGHGAVVALDRRDRLRRCVTWKS